MKRVGLKDLQPGQTLARDLCDIRGRLIVKAGSVLTEKHIRVIKTWGIAAAYVSENHETPSKNDCLPEEIKDRIQTICSHRFRDWNRDNPLHLKLMEGFKHRLFRHYRLDGVQALEAFQPKSPQEESLKPIPGVSSSDPTPEPFKLDLESVKLPSLPSIVVRLNEAVNDPNSTTVQISEIVNKDLGLTARLLRLVNSAMYSFPSRIQSIPRAITIIGPRQIVSLAIGTSVISLFHGISPAIMDVTEFWKHSIATGIIARSLAGFKNSFETENVFIAGLLHDIGKLILFLEYPETSQFILHRAKEERVKLAQLEQSILNTTHGEIGAKLVNKWNLPSYLASCCANHHEPKSDGVVDLALMVNMADDIANALGYGQSGEPVIPLSSERTWSQAGLTLEIVDNLLEQVELCFENTVAGFLADP